MNVESIEKDFRGLVESETDLLNLVVKLHYSIDKVLDKALSESLPQANAMELRRVSFLVKVDFLSALHVLSLEVRPYFDFCNSTRNTFAHNPYATFQGQDEVKAKSLLLSYPRPLVPKSFKEEKGSVEILKTLFAVCFLQVVVSYEQVCKQKVLNLISSEMAHEATSSGGRKFKEGMSVYKETELRCIEQLSALYPALSQRSFTRGRRRSESLHRCIIAFRYFKKAN